MHYYGMACEGRELLSDLVGRGWVAVGQRPDGLLFTASVTCWADEGQLQYFFDRLCHD
jgi:hypothetical protein